MSDQLPQISVVIPTHERAELLERSLESFTAQTLPRSRFEVIVVDDGSEDPTADVCARLAEDLQLRYLRIDKAGTSAAKNLGLFASKAPLVLFFDDDDLADTTLLEAHVDVHQTHPEDNVAVLGYTTWAPELEVTPVMAHLTELGQQMFSYSSIEDGQWLDHTYFWAGRVSCKRSLLVHHGAYDQDFEAIEDIELGFRLAQHGLRVVYARSARSFMARPVTFDDFARRCVKHGRFLWLFSRRHSDPPVQSYCRVAEALAKWSSLEPVLEGKVERIRELERRYEEDGVLGDAAYSELDDLYRWTFEALRARGIAEAAAEASEATPAQPEVVSNGRPPAAAICPDPVFVIGSPRSGTTVLAHALAQHSDFWVSGESHFLTYLFPRDLPERAYDRAMEVAGQGWLRAEDVSKDEFLAHVGMGVNALITSRSQGLRWIDQTPHYTMMVGTLARLFPGARFLHILRDGREVVHSMLNFADAHPDPEVADFLRQSVPWATDMRSACEFWRDHVDTAMVFCEEQPARAMVVRHEELVTAPDGMFRRIHEFLRAADEDGPASFLASKRLNSSFSGASRLSATEIWEGWNEEQRRLFAEVAGPTMTRCGFWVPDEARGRPGGDRARGECAKQSAPPL
ncbi:MAG TPA: sulfotransferase [Thermoleophilaceae bacterium]